MFFAYSQARMGRSLQAHHRRLSAQRYQSRKRARKPSLALHSSAWLFEQEDLLADMIIQARLCPNSIVNSDFELPLRISKFCKEIHAGFGLLNLKNDSLRKRFDGMKYDIKKMEEVVYDISLRGLVKATSGAENASAVSEGTTTADAEMPSAKRVRDPAV